MNIQHEYHVNLCESIQYLLNHNILIQLTSLRQGKRTKTPTVLRAEDLTILSSSEVRPSIKVIHRTFLSTYKWKEWILQENKVHCAYCRNSLLKLKEKKFSHFALKKTHIHLWPNNEIKIGSKKI